MERYPNTPPFRRRLRSSIIIPTVVVVAAYVSMAVLAYWHVWSNHPASTIQPGGDAMLDTWFLAWTPQALAHLRNPLFSDYANFPFGINLIVNTGEPLLGALMSPVTLLFGPIATYNTLMTGALALSATSGYVFARRFTNWRPAAFIAGAFYGFSPYMISTSYDGHIHLSFAVLPPLIFLVLHEILVRQTWRPWKASLLLAALISAQFFISSEVLTTTAMVAICAIVAVSVVGRGSLRSHLPYALSVLASAGAISAVVLAYPVWFGLFGPAHISGPIQLVPEAYRADLLGPLIPDFMMHFNVASLLHIANHFATTPGENGSYIGLPLLVLLVVGALWLRKSKVVLVAAISALCAFVLSLGGALTLSATPRISLNGAAAGIVPLPEGLVSKLPLFKNLIPSRISLYVALFAALVLAVVLEELHNKLHQSHPIVSIAAPLLTALIVLAPLLPSVTPFEASPAGIPPFFSAGRDSKVPAGSVALLYPYPTAAFPNPQLWQANTNLRFKAPGGYFLVPQGPNHLIAFNPPLLSYSVATLPATVFTELNSGHPPPMTSGLRSALWIDLRSWHVSTVIATVQASQYPTTSLSFLTWLFGPPSDYEYGTYVWYKLRWSPGPCTTRCVQTHR